MIFLLKKWIKKLTCSHKWRVSSEGRYVGNSLVGVIYVFHLECWHCQKTKDVITYREKPKI